ncbi:MAG: FAD-dependent oxidoreductase [Minicystis sp.]
MSIQRRTFGESRKGDSFTTLSPRSAGTSTRHALVSTGAAAMLSGLAFFSPAKSAASPLHCDVVIIGGGPAGLHTAYKLITQHLTAGPVCLFEKSDHLGGRVGDNYSVGFAAKAFTRNGVKVLNSGQTGTGGYRMYDNQYTYQLGQELAALGKPGQLTFLAQNAFNQLASVDNQGLNASYTEARYFSYATSSFAPLYNSPVSDDDMWTALLCGPQVPVSPQGFPLYRQMAIPGVGNMSTGQYLQWVSENVIAPSHGPDVAQYLLDAWRFRGDFDNPNDTASYLEFAAKDFAGGSTYYPVPSFQPYFEIMSAQTTKLGGKIYLNEKVVSVNTQCSGPRYVVQTANRTVTANKVIIATPPNALHSSAPGGITGDVIQQIVSQPIFNNSTPTIAVTVTHQFGNGTAGNTGFWHNDITYPSGPKLLGPQLGAADLPIRRSSNNILIAGELLPGCNKPSCNFTQVGFFNNTNELPLTDYHDFINVSRSVYNDQTEAVHNWVALYNAGEALSPNGGGNAAINKQILKSLRIMYPKVFTGNPATEPSIRATKMTVHDPAWYLLKQGALAQQVTNDSLFAWSLHPVAGEKVYMVGDTWRPDLSGWSDGAYKSSIQVLNTYFGANINPLEGGTIGCDDGQIVFP